MGECKAGLRRWTGTDWGDAYGRTLSHVGNPDYANPSVGDRLLGDYLSPRRPGTPTTVVNIVSREVGTDVAGWRWDRLVSFAAGLERERRQRPDA